MAGFLRSSGFGGDGWAGQGFAGPECRLTDKWAAAEKEAGWPWPLGETPRPTGPAVAPAAAAVKMVLGKMVDDQGALAELGMPARVDRNWGRPKNGPCASGRNRSQLATMAVTAGRAECRTKAPSRAPIFHFLEPAAIRLGIARGASPMQGTFTVENGDYSPILDGE